MRRYGRHFLICGALWSTRAPGALAPFLATRVSRGGRDVRGRVSTPRRGPHESWATRLATSRTAGLGNWVWHTRAYSSAASQLRATPSRHSSALALVRSSLGATAITAAASSSCFPGAFGVGVGNAITTHTLGLANVGSLVSRVEWASRRVAAARGTRALVLLRLSSNSVLLVLPSGALVAAPVSATTTTAATADYAAARSGRTTIRPAALGLRAGRRPTVRGVAKNPNDHPHGGRTRCVIRPRTP